MSGNSSRRGGKYVKRFDNHGLEDFDLGDFNGGNYEIPSGQERVQKWLQRGTGKSG